jgi:hypothetical protein
MGLIDNATPINGYENLVRAENRIAPIPIGSVRAALARVGCGRSAKGAFLLE